MEYEVELTEEAATGFAQVIEYLEANHWYKAAGKLTYSFYSAISSLAKFPYEFPATLNDPDLRKIVLESNQSLAIASLGTK